MKTPLILFCLLVAMCGVMLVAFLADEAPNARGVSHSRIEEMDEGGLPSRHSPDLLALGWAFGMLQIGVYVGCLVLASRNREARRLIALLILCGLVYAGAFTGMTFVYAQSLFAAEPAFLGPFPASTSWMLFVLWPVPLLFVVCYVAGFRRWVWTSEDRERFEEILALRDAEVVD